MTTAIHRVTEDETRPFRCSLLVYDVPDGTKCPQPSSFLWRHAARINLSAWIVPEERVPLLPTDLWTTSGVRWRIFGFKESEAELLLAAATESLLERVEQKRRALDEGLRTVRESYEEAARQGGAHRVVALGHAGSTAYNHVRRARAALEEARECALAFSITGRVTAVVDGLRQLIRAREALYFEMDRAARGAEAAASAQQVLGEAVAS